MKIQVKTLNQKSLSVDIDAQKTVLDLKKELALYPDIGVSPEQQKLIYAGKILENADTLCECNIDEKKFLVVMIVKSKPKEEEPAAAAAAVAEGASGSAAAAAATADESAGKSKTESKVETTATTTATTTPTTPTLTTQQPAQPRSEQDDMVANIVSMGYPEAEVRQALEASFNNPERAVEYLIEGIPMSPNLGEGGGFINESDADAELPPFELLRTDPVFRNLRSLIQQNPELIDEAVQRIGEANPALLTMINDHQQEFLNMLFEQSDDEDVGDD